MTEKKQKISLHNIHKRFTEKKHNTEESPNFNLVGPVKFPEEHSAGVCRSVCRC